MLREKGREVADKSGGHSSGEDSGDSADGSAVRGRGMEYLGL